MTFRTIAVAGVAAATMVLSGAAQAQVVQSATQICERDPTTGAWNTVKLRFFHFSDVYLNFAFTRQPSGPVTPFGTITPTNTGPERRFALPAGTYKLKYKQPSSTTYAAYPGADIVVRPFVITGQTCNMRPLDKVDKVGPGAS